MRRLLLPFALLLLALLVPASAHASSSQVMTFEAPSELLSDATRESTLDEIQAMGVRHIRALVYWRYTSARPNSKRKPRFDMTDPGAYPAGTWDLLDRLVESVRRRGMTAQLTLTGPVPKWATKRRKGHIDDPGAKLFGKWAKAVARRYGDRIDMWSIWNEPNHPDFLGPQYKKGRPHSPKRYRRLYAAGERAIHRTRGDADDLVLFGETAPIGNENVVSPLAFLRKALCLNRRYQAKGRCRKLRVDGYAHHAYTRKVGPTFVSEDRDEVSIGSLGRLSAALDRAARAGRIDHGVGIYLTEFGIQSSPDRIAGVSLKRQAEYLAIAERMAYANPRVKAFSQYLLHDDGPVKGAKTRLERFSGFETGLRTHKGRKKPAYRAFMLPLAVTQYGSTDVGWGRVRPATGPTQVTIQRKVGRGSWKKVTTVDTAGVYAFKADHRRRERYRVRWTRPDGRRLKGPPIRSYEP